MHLVYFDIVYTSTFPETENLITYFAPKNLYLCYFDNLESLTLNRFSSVVKAEVLIVVSTLSLLSSNISMNAQIEAKFADDRAISLSERNDEGLIAKVDTALSNVLDSCSSYFSVLNLCKNLFHNLKQKITCLPSHYSSYFFKNTHLKTMIKDFMV